MAGAETSGSVVAADCTKSIFSTIVESTGEVGIVCSSVDFFLPPPRKDFGVGSFVGLEGAFSVALDVPVAVETEIVFAADGAVAAGGSETDSLATTSLVTTASLVEIVCSTLIDDDDCCDGDV